MHIYNFFSYLKILFKVIFIFKAELKKKKLLWFINKQKQNVWQHNTEARGGKMVKYFCKVKTTNVNTEATIKENEGCYYPQGNKGDHLKL